MTSPTTRLRLRVVPSASEAGVVGRYGDAWKLRVTAAPDRGRANESVLDLVAASLDLRRPDVRIVGGTASRDKTVEVIGLTRVEADRRMTASQKGLP